MYFKENIWGIGAKYLLHSFAKENISKITKKTWGRAFQRKGIWILQEILSENQVVKKHNQTSALLIFFSTASIEYCTMYSRISN